MPVTPHTPAADLALLDDNSATPDEVLDAVMGIAEGQANERAARSLTCFSRATTTRTTATVHQSPPETTESPNRPNPTP